MPYIDKNPAGQITAIYANAQREGHEFVESATVYTAPLTKAQRIAALLAPYKLERITVQVIIGMAEMRADLTALQTLGLTTREADLANSFAKNTAYRIARTLENACQAIEAGA